VASGTASSRPGLPPLVPGREPINYPVPVAVASLELDCPDCGEPIRLPLNPAGGGAPSGRGLLSEHLGWSRDEPLPDWAALILAETE